MDQSINKIIHLPTDFTNPFLKDKVDRITIEIRHISVFHPQSVSANIWFVNGNTDGIQKITGDDLSSVVNQIESFINSL